MNILRIQIQDPEIPPGFRIRIQIQPLGISPVFSPNPAIKITKQIKKFKRRIFCQRLRKTELCQQNPFQYYSTLTSYKANIRVLEYQLQMLRHFIA